MKTKRIRVWLIASIGLIGLAYALMPLADPVHEIKLDEDAIEKKITFLESVGGESEAREKRPNVIVILADDLGKTDISLYGGTTVDTPHIDSIGRNGVTFTNGYCTSSICSPSRASLLTGRYAQRFGYETQPNNRYPRNRLEFFFYTNFMDMGAWKPNFLESVPGKRDILKQGLPPSEITLAELLQANGYATGLLGKWHLGYSEPFQPTKRGFDYSYGFYEAFSLYAPIDDPDIVNHPHDYFASRHIWAQERKGTSAMRRNEKVIQVEDYLTYAITDETVRFVEQHKDDPFFAFVSFSAPHTPFQAPKDVYDRFAHVEDENKRVYYSMIAALDDSVGRILEAVEVQGLLENTIIWFASDNGGATYTGATDNAPLKGGKFNHFEGGVNVPFMVQWPGTMPAGKSYDHLASLLDVFTTSAAATNTALPSHVEYDGVNLLSHLQDDETVPRDTLFWRTHHMKAARTEKWKLITDARDGRTWLYDLEVDPGEATNLSATLTPVVVELLAQIAEWETTLAEPAWPRLVDYQFVIDGDIFDYPL